MVKPRMIILIRHAQSEGNRNRDIHQTIPDHRVKLTSEGHGQAEDAGRRLRSLLKSDDTIRIFTSPYQRTRETTEGIPKSLTSDNPSPSPFSRDSITVFEEPRLREQDFGNFQPCSAAMNRMWMERSEYGPFFYRIPDGESAADAYDRVSGFNESLWRQFSEDDFPSVCVLVTHGLMTRVFLMKWYHWTVEHFEDLRNVDHCEFVVMKKEPANGKYILESRLRTWSDWRKNRDKHDPVSKKESPTPKRKWGGCPDGCNHGRPNGFLKRKSTATKPSNSKTEESSGDKSDSADPNLELQSLDKGIEQLTVAPETSPKTKATIRASVSNLCKVVSPNRLLVLRAGRDGGGSMSGFNSQAESSSEDEADHGKPSEESDESGNGPGSPRQHQKSRRAYADSLGDRSDTDSDEHLALQNMKDVEAEENSVRRSVY